MSFVLEIIQEILWFFEVIFRFYSEVNESRNISFNILNENSLNLRASIENKRIAFVGTFTLLATLKI